jgi:hypothetical protein
MKRAMKGFSVVVALMLALAFAPATAHAAGPKGFVKGKVVKADGTPAAEATVQLMARPAAPKTPAESKAEKPAEGAKPATKQRVKPESVGQASTNAQGEFTIADVADGQYTVVARVKNEGAARERVVVHAGQAANVTLTLKARGEGKNGATANTTKAERKRARLQRRHEKAAQQQQQAAVPQQ